VDLGVDAGTDAGRQDVSDVPDVPAVDVAVCPGRSARECLTEAQVESRIRTPPQGGGGPFDAGAADVPPITVPREPNGCYQASAVRDGCCNPAARVEREGDLCCYIYCQGSCCGRPFLVDGVARRAAAVPSPSWSTSSPVGGGLGPAERAAIARAWRDDALLEHASVAAFARFTLQLMALGGPPDLLADAQRAALDEIDHARRCFDIARAIDGEAAGPGPLDVAGALGDVTLGGVTRAIIAEGCVGETVAALLVRRRAGFATHPLARAALDRIADDEGRHAALAWRFVAWALRTGGEALRPVVRAAFAEALAGLDATLAPTTVDASTWRAHGLATADDERAVLASARRDLFGPCVEALLAGAQPPRTQACGSTAARLGTLVLSPEARSTSKPHTLDVT
jgi:hypothetical protein